MEQHTSLRADPYILAYRYWDYMKEHPRRKNEKLNLYYERLLANQPSPDPAATDDRSRAIRYAKEHYESFYEVRDIECIIKWLDEDDANPKAKPVLIAGSPMQKLS
ncbi:hypothetical protein HBI14_153410 [Parastagonospora nodorum]|nr:hypothetical protein HBI14_153410 [Parastagonospora nodorum]